MGEQQKKSGRGVNVRQIFITASQQIAIYGLASKFKISEKSAILLALSRGLKEFGFMNVEDYEKDLKKRIKPLVQKVEENKQNRVEEAKKNYENAMNEQLSPKQATQEDLDSIKNNYNVTIEETDTDFIVNPKAMLCTEKFIELSSVVKRLGGDYISKGQTSCWKIPKKLGGE